MKNPYEENVFEDEIRIDRPILRIGVVFFCLFLFLPGLSLVGIGFPSGPLGEAGPAAPSGAGEWLKHLEAKADRSPLFEQWRKTDQARLSRFFGAGNQRVHAGRENWLYYRSDLDAVFGKGPYYEEPSSVARERFDRAWRSPIPEVKRFAVELAERGIRLILVPIPTKPMICREGLGLPPVGPPHQILAGVMTDLRSAGIEVIDLFPLLLEKPDGEDSFLKQDTHWTPVTSAAAAREVATRVAATGRGPALVTREEIVERESGGDLVGMLDIGEKDALFLPERLYLRRVLNGETGEPLKSDPKSEVVVLGDSFVNIFEDPALGFGSVEETTIGAGFSSHLAAALGRTIHTIAINGGGATGVREAFAGLYDDQVRAKKTVIWVLSSRDLLLPEIPARRAGIEWRPVSFNQKNSTDAGSGRELMEVTAILREKSLIEDPAQTPYASATYSTIFDGIEGAVGDQSAVTELSVFFWAFRDRKLEPGSRLEPGRTYRLRLVPLADHAEANRATRLDDFFRPELTPWFAVDFSEVEGK